MVAEDRFSLALFSKLLPTTDKFRFTMSVNMLSLLSLWRQNGDEDSAVSMQDIFTRRPYTKIDAIGRLHVISALDNGHSKVEVARKFGVHPQTIAYIYKQKERILKQCKQKLICMKDVRSLNLDLTLLDWFKTQAREGTIIYEQQMRNKANEILSSSDQEFEGLDNWLVDFRIRHNILKHSSDNDFNVHSTDKWLKLIQGFHMQDVYVGGTCALLHRLDLDHYLDDSKTDQYISLLYITSSSGTEKKELLVIGGEYLDDSGKLSLPLEYCQRLEGKPVLTYSNLLNYLNKWDIVLQGVNRKVALILDIPNELLEKIQFDNIKVIHPSKVNYLDKTFEKISLSFKHNYRKQQITKFFSQAKEDAQSILPYLNMVSLAWHCVSATYIHRLFYPPPEGSLHLHEIEDEIKTENLSEWSQSCNLPLDPETYSALDKYVFCDKDIQSLTTQLSECKEEHFMSELVQNSNESSAIEAYQALKRLIVYMQGENANGATIESARALENHLEYCALAEMHGMLSADSTNITE